MNAAVRLPAEWEPQAGTILVWPHEDTDWGPRLDAAESAFGVLAAAIAAHQPVLVVVRDRNHGERALGSLPEKTRDSRNVILVHCPFDDTWVRDFGPVTVFHGQVPRLLDFRFDGWGGKYRAGRDDALTRNLHRKGVFGETELNRFEFVLEGGAIDTDGKGTLLTTRHCWKTRHPSLSRGDLETRFRDWLGIERCLWLAEGRLEGDDTDAHVDTLARFCAPDLIAYQACEDSADPHFRSLRRMADELAAFKGPDNGAYRLVPLPWPGEIRDEHGRPLPATYANFLFVNKALLVPTYDVPADEVALDRLQEELPDRRVVGVPSRELIWQNGSLHCSTMQLPEGVPLPGAD